MDRKRERDGGGGKTSQHLTEGGAEIVAIETTMTSISRMSRASSRPEAALPAKGGKRPRIPRMGFVTLSTLATLLFLAAIQPTAEGKARAGASVE